jgi:hypothetical protein
VVAGVTRVTVGNSGDRDSGSSGDSRENGAVGQW